MSDELACPEIVKVLAEMRPRIQNVFLHPFFLMVEAEFEIRNPVETTEVQCHIPGSSQ